MASGLIKQVTVLLLVPLVSSIQCKWRSMEVNLHALRLNDYHQMLIALTLEGEGI